MMLPEGVENVLLLNEKQMQDLRKARNKTRLPQSLSALAIKSVAEHFTRLVDVPDSPLKYLPNTIVQQLLSKIASVNKFKNITMPLPLIHQVLGLLVNPNVTELDCTVFDRYFRDKTLNNYLLKHALENCPKIQKIKVRNNEPSKALQCSDYCWYSEGLEVLLLCFKKSWNNLTTINFEENFSCNACDIEFLQENFPNIEELTVCLFMGFDAQTVVDHLVNMERLHTLNLFKVVGNYFSYEYRDGEHSEMMEFYNNVAGSVPSLRYFYFAKCDNQIGSAEFIDLFGVTYPCKNLLVDKLRITKGLKRKWPKNLSVKDLTIDCNLSDIEIENLSTIECSLHLTVIYRCRLMQQTHKVLDCIGGLVNSLTLKNNSHDTEIILERMLAACPNLERFKIFWPRSSVVQDPKYNMSPAAFKNYKSFEIECLKGEYESDIGLREVFRKFLIGTEVCDTLELQYDEHQLQDLAQVALAYPKSLQQLRELHTNFFNNPDYPEYDKARFDKYYECFYVLLTCCHKLERIFSSISHHERFAKESVNRHLATIRCLDPNFIQNYTPLWGRL